MARLVFVSRSIDVAGGGGIGAYVTAQARLLAKTHDVTVISEQGNRGLLDAAVGDMPQIETITVEAPSQEQTERYFDYLHAYSAAVWRTIQSRFADDPPAYIEFPDYLGEGAVTVQARASGHELLRDTKIGIRAYTTSEMVSLLNGSFDDSFNAQVVHDMERYALRNADFFVHAGGDLVQMYDRFFGEGNVAPGFLVRHPIGFKADGHPPHDADGPLRVLYIGRTERRKGIYDLVKAIAGAPYGDWQLTVIGGDTHTGPAETSMTQMLELAAMSDNRIEIRGRVPHEEIPAAVREHDAVVIPSRWECWPNTGLETLAQNRPILATPVGGLVEMVKDGETGLLARGNDAEALAELFERAVEQRASLRAMTAERRPVQHFEALAADDVVAAGYQQLIDAPGRYDVHDLDARPLVSVIVPYFQLSEFIEATVESIFAQHYRPLEVIVVNDGSFAPEDQILLRLAEEYPIKVVSKPNGGLGAARNFGVAQSRGRYVLPLDADNTLGSDFIERAVTVLESRAEVPYVTAWTRYIDSAGEPLEADYGFQAIGNEISTVENGNVAGDAMAVIRREIFDQGNWYSEELTSFEDWFFYRELKHQGRFGLVIPERLVNYRVREDSMLQSDGAPNLGVLERQMNGLITEASLQWTYQSA